jgi:hypothetical protein
MENDDEQKKHIAALIVAVQQLGHVAQLQQNAIEELNRRLEIARAAIERQQDLLKLSGMRPAGGDPRCN